MKWQGACVTLQDGPQILLSNELFEAKWRIYTSVKKAIIVWDNGLWPNRHQSNIWTDADLS